MVTQLSVVSKPIRPQSKATVYDLTQEVLHYIGYHYVTRKAIVFQMFWPESGCSFALWPIAGLGSLV